MLPDEVTVNVSLKTFVVGSVIHAPLLTTPPLNVPTLVSKFTVPVLVNAPLITNRPLLARTKPLLASPAPTTSNVLGLLARRLPWLMSLLLIVPKPLMVPAAKFVRLPPMTDPPSMDTVLALVQAAKTLSVALLLRTAVPIRFGALCNVRVAPVVGDKVAPALMV